MVNFEVDFTGGDFDDHHKAGIRDTLRRIDWAHPVHGVEVVRRLTGGVGGALVLQIRLVVGSASRVKVVKIAPAAETNREWHAYWKWIAPFANAWCTPLPERTPDRTPDDPARAWTALAYDHVGQFAGSPEETVRTLEELGGRGLADLAAAVDEILTRIRDVLHKRCELVPDKLSLRGLNPELGPNLVLEVERLSGDGLPRQSTSDYTLLHRDDVLRRTVSGGPHDIEDGTRVTVGELRVERRDGVVLAVDDEIVVELRPAPDAGPGLGELADGAPVSVWGRVVSARGRACRDRVAVAMGRTAEEHSFADPFAVLPKVLCDEQLVGRVDSVSHGDLNLRNVLCVGNDFFLIDYARVCMRPQQTDFCWLELGVVRDVLAGHDFGDLLRLHRCLALATALLEFGCPADDVSGLVNPLAGAAMRDAFELLFVLRRQAWACYPDHAGPRLSEEYLRHLLLAAHRAMKWSEERRAPEKVRAAVAVAAVAAEWLNGENPCQHWDRPLLSAALAALAPAIPLGDDNAVRLAVDLVTAVAAFGPPDDEVEPAVAILAARLVERRCDTAARRLLARPHGGFVDLSTTPDGPGVVKTLANTGDVTLLGPPGSGKSTVACELARRLATAVVAGRPARMPVLVEDAGLLTSYPDLLGGTGLAEVAAEALTLGAVHVIVDADPTGADPRIQEFVATVRARFPRTRMVVCQREAGAVSGRVAELQPLSHDDMVYWLRRGLTDRMDAEHLVKVLTDDPRWAWVDLDRPRWISLVAGYVREHGLQDPLPAPHEVIALMPERVDVSRDVRLRRSHLRAHELADAAADAAADAVVDGVRRIGEWDAYRILVTLPGTDPGLVRRLGAALEDARPVMAAELLRAAGLDGAEFAARMVTVLRDPQSGPLRWRASADALRVLAEPHGAAGLARVAVDGTVPEDAARAAFASLGELYYVTLPRPQLRDVAGRLAAVVRRVLDTPELAARREAALAAAAGIPGLELHIVPLIDEAVPWPVLDGACRALRSCGVTMPLRLVAIRAAASRARLAVLDTTLPSLTTRAEIDAAHAERRRLIAELAPTATLPWLLRRRFAFDAHRQVAAMVDQHLDDEPDDDTTQDEELMFQLRAHRLLRDAPGTAGTVLTRLAAGASVTRLLVAAAAVPYTDQSQMGHLADRFTALLDTVEADHLEGMAALILAISWRDRWLGMRLARTATATLVRRDLRERHHWPWADAVARIHGAARDLDAMLCADGDTADAAVTALMSHDFHRSGRPGPIHHLSERARQRLLALPRTAGWALAAAAATLVEVLPELPNLVTTPDTVVRRRSARYGMVEQAEAADVLAVIGYLARTAYDQGRMASEVAAVCRFLSGFDSGGRHPSVATGRLIGLAYLGDWQPVLRADLSDPRLRDAARHAVERWLPGPATPVGGESAVAVARWISERLREESVPITHRWVLEDLRERAEAIAGVLVER